MVQRDGTAEQDTTHELITHVLRKTQDEGSIPSHAISHF